LKAKEVTATPSVHVAAVVAALAALAALGASIAAIGTITMAAAASRSLRNMSLSPHGPCDARPAGLRQLAAGRAMASL